MAAVPATATAAAATTASVSASPEAALLALCSYADADSDGGPAGDVQGQEQQQHHQQQQEEEQQEQVRAIAALLERPDIDLSWREPGTGRTALMAAAARGDAALVSLLLEAGMPYNLQDVDGRTAGEYALLAQPVPHEAVFNQLVNHGCNAELVLAAMNRRSDGGGAAPSMEATAAAASNAAINAAYLSQPLRYEDGQLVDAERNGVMMGWEDVLMRRHAEQMMMGSVFNRRCTRHFMGDRPLLAAPLAQYAQNRNTDAGAEAEAEAPTVYYDYEEEEDDAMDEDRERKEDDGGPQSPPPAPTHRKLHVLNVGFGLGIIDAYLQHYAPALASHTIIEAHPDVYAHMLSEGWDRRPGVRILFGRWQDVLAQAGTRPTTDADAASCDDGPFQYDAIFFDTFGEYYDQLRHFHGHLKRMLAPTGVYSFFNGLGATNLFFHAVYCNIVQLELLEHCDLETVMRPVSLARVLSADVWRRVKAAYFSLDTYLLPTCTFSLCE